MTGALNAETLTDLRWAREFADVILRHASASGSFKRWSRTNGQRLPWMPRAAAKFAYEDGFEIGLRAGLCILQEVGAFASSEEFASAIEARRAIDAVGGVVGDESAVGGAETP